MSWPVVELGSFCEFKYGKSLAAKDRVPGPVSVFGSNGQVGCHQTSCTAGPTIIIGRKGSFGEVNYSEQSCWPIDTTYYVDETCSECDLKWLYYMLPKLRLTELNKAAAVPGLNRNDAYERKIPLPPLDEQRRIAAILDKADSIRKKRQQSLDMLDDFLRATFLDMFGDPVTNPKGWETVPFSAVVDDIVGGWSANGLARPAKTDEMGVLKISAVTSGEYSPGENKAVNFIPAERRLIVPQAGDLLFSRANTRELVAAMCIVDHTAANVFLPDKLWRVDLNGRVCAPYIKYLFAHEEFRALLCRKATGTSGSMLNISKAKLREHLIPLPDKSVQLSFSRVFKSVNVLKRKLFAEVGEAEMLFASLSQLAFRGEL